jgi:hypothetical protein
MKANELRLGNLVCDVFNKTNEVTRIELDDFACMLNYRNSNNHPIPYIPIQLNDEWFKKSGAKLDNNGNWWFDLNECSLEFIQANNKYYPKYFESAEFSSMENNIVNLKCVQYFHELQNLYYILTGTKLTIV